MTYVLLALMAISFAVFASIIVRKFPQAAHVDLDNLPEEKEARKKKEIMSRRMQAEGGEMLRRLGNRFKPLRKVWGFLQLKFRVYVGKIERVLHHEQRAKKKAQSSGAEETSRAENTLHTAATQFGLGEYDKAESLYINVISTDPKSIEAYRGLAETYLAKGAREEAEETLHFLLKLKPDDDGAMVKLAEMAEAKGDLEQAIKFYEQAMVLNDALSPRFYHLAELLVKVKQPLVAKEAILSAVELEPKNPKYLDLLIEVGILCGDKDLAMHGFQELRLVNPKNQKLQVFQDRIKELV